MKVLFLDIDGVLNSHEWCQRNKKPEGEGGGYLVRLDRDFDKDAVKVLNTILQKSGAKVVISSSWRILHSIAEIDELLKKHGFVGEIIGKTPRRMNLNDKRGDEIQAWLDGYAELHGNEVEEFVIIDDDSDMKHLLGKLVQTSWNTGLLEQHITPALEMLKCESSSSEAT